MANAAAMKMKAERKPLGLVTMLSLVTMTRPVSVDCNGKNPDQSRIKREWERKWDSKFKQLYFHRPLYLKKKNLLSI